MTDTICFVHDNCCIDTSMRNYNFIIYFNFISWFRQFLTGWIRPNESLCILKQKKCVIYYFLCSTIITHKILASTLKNMLSIQCPIFSLWRKNVPLLSLLKNHFFNSSFYTNWKKSCLVEYRPIIVPHIPKIQRFDNCT